jgi:hypothetical protein
MKSPCGRWQNAGQRQIVKERIEVGTNEKAALKFSITALSFVSISIFPG